MSAKFCKSTCVAASLAGAFLIISLLKSNYRHGGIRGLARSDDSGSSRGLSIIDPRTIVVKKSLGASCCTLGNANRCLPGNGFAVNRSLLAELLRELEPELSAGLTIGTRVVCENDVRLMFQMEHNLVKKGGRGADGFPLGKVVAEDGTPYHARVVKLARYAESDIVIEYSMPNIENMKQSGLFQENLMRKVVYVPPLQWNYNPGSAETRDIGVAVTFFFGKDMTSSPRRKELIEKLQSAGVELHFVGGVPAQSNEMQNVFDRARIVINVHQTPHHHTLEEFRVLPALTRGAIVVSESVPLQNTIPYAESIVFAQYDNLVDTVVEVERNYKQWYERIHGANAPTRRILQGMREKTKADLKTRLQAVAAET